MEHIAIVGIGCRFPGASNPEALWEFLSQGRSGISIVPSDRWDVDEFFSADPVTPGKMNSKYGAFIDGIRDFDADIFGISPREARHLDPQQRLLLEVVWEAFEDGGLPLSRIPKDRTGVFVGIMGSDHTHHVLDDLANMNAHSGAGIGYCLAANRISYQFDLGGPSMAIDTACSSSLVAAHLACQSLKSGESDIAVAAGVNLILSPALNVFYTKAGLMSPNGACRTFDSAANGIVRGEGAGVVILKRVSDAVANGDRIYAVIRGSAVNQDGRSNGITAPNRWAQERVIKAAHQQAGVIADAVKYVELHGTGTLLGDPIEAQALATVLGTGRQQPCAVGSIKTNIGHLEGAAGIAGLIKVALMLRHRHYVPSLHFTKLNPHIDAAKIPMRIQTEASPFPNTGVPLIAGISSFGLGGTNAHMVLEEPSTTFDHNSEIQTDFKAAQVLRLSAPTRQGLLALAGSYAEFLAGKDNHYLRNICFTANTTRSEFAHRAVINIKGLSTAAETLQAFSMGVPQVSVKDSARHARKIHKIGFMFTGQGAQYLGMASVLYKCAPVFRDSLDECARILDSLLPKSLLSVMFSTDQEDDAINQTRYSQPALFSVEYSLAKLLASWGVEPDVVMGHSIGEYVAACLAGAYTLEDSLLLVAERARLMSELPVKGGMVAVFSSAESILPLMKEFGDAVVIAALNGPSNTVISGDGDALSMMEERFVRAGYRCIRLDVSIPFHSPHIRPMITAFEQRVAGVKLNTMNKSLVSNLTGQVLIQQDLMSPSYWSRHACEPVRFEAGVRKMQELGCNILIELGPRAALSAMASHFLESSAVALVPTLRANKNDWESMADCVGVLYALGVDIDWMKYESVLGGRKIDVPMYPFQRKHFSVLKRSSSVKNQSDPDVSKTYNNPIEVSDMNVSINLPNTPTGIPEEIRQIVATVGQMPVRTVEQNSRPFNDLGFDSLMLVELQTLLAKRFPRIEDMSLGRLFAGASVADIATHVMSFVGKATPNGLLPADTKPTCLREVIDVIAAWIKDSRKSARIAHRLVHKVHPENVLLARLESVAPDIVVAEIFHDLEHKFFYEHEKDHVPGLYLIEAARQCGTALAHLYYGVSDDRPFIMNDLKVKFTKFAENTMPLFMVGKISDLTYLNGILTHMAINATFVQDGFDIGSIEGGFMISDPTLYAVKRKLTLVQPEDMEAI